MSRTAPPPKTSAVLVSTGIWWFETSSNGPHRPPSARRYGYLMTVPLVNRQRKRLFYNARTLTRRERTRLERQLITIRARMMALDADTRTTIMARRSSWTWA